MSKHIPQSQREKAIADYWFAKGKQEAFREMSLDVGRLQNDIKGSIGNMSDALDDALTLLKQAKPD